MFKLIFWIVVAILAASFFGISLQSIINSPAGQENFAYLYNLLLIGWDWIVALVVYVIDWIKGLIS